MIKNSKFNIEANARNMVEVTISLEEEGIRYRIKGRIEDLESGEKVANSKVVAADDEMWNAIFGSSRAVKRYVKSKKTIKKILPLSQLGYENCIMKSV